MYSRCENFKFEALPFHFINISPYQMNYLSSKQFLVSERNSSYKGLSLIVENIWQLLMKNK